MPMAGYLRQRDKLLKCFEKSQDPLRHCDKHFKVFTYFLEASILSMDGRPSATMRQTFEMFLNCSKSSKIF